jgi:hypothetical protein
MNQYTKNKILKKGIIRSEEDWNRAFPEQLSLAELFLNLSESSLLDGVEDPTDEEKIVFLEETQQINDLSDLKNVDKVESGKTFESDAVQIGIPIKILPLIRQIYSEMMEDNG